MIQTQKWNNINEPPDEPNWDKWIIAIIVITLVYNYYPTENSTKKLPKHKVHKNKKQQTNQLKSQQLSNQLNKRPSANVYVKTLDNNKYTSLFIAMKKKKSKVVAKLLKHNPNLHGITKHGHTILHCAAKYNYIEVVKKCLQAKVDINAKTYKAHWTALHYAARKGHKKIIILLKESGANPNIRLSHGHTAHAILHLRDPDLASYLQKPLPGNSMLPGDYLKSVSALPKNSYLFEAVQRGEIGIIAQAIEANKIKNQPIDEYGKSLLAVALKDNKLQISCLLASNNANLFSTDMFGNTILHWAVLRSDTWLINNILSNRENINSQNIRYETPLYVAVKINNAKVVRLLLANGADTSIKNIAGQSIYDFFQHSSNEIQTLIAKTAEIAPAKEFPSNNAEVEIKNSESN